MKIRDDNNPPLPAGLLQDLEERIDHALPKSYRIFLEDHNGGRPFPRYFQIPDCSAEGILDHLLGFGRRGEDLMQWLKELDELSGKFLAIGFDPGGNVLLLDYHDGSIHYWDTAFHFESSTDDGNAYWIANSFDDFLANLHESQSS